MDFSNMSSVLVGQIYERYNLGNYILELSYYMENVKIKIPDKYKVNSISYDETKEWILKKHYAHRMPSISYSFGLFDGLLLVGVMTIGKPASPSLCVGVCGEEYAQIVYELNRLVVSDGLEKNTLSYFVSQSLKLLKLEMIIVSYADTQYGHHGYIYQATNWIYTGATKERTDIGLEDGTHSRHYDKEQDYNVNRKFRSSKHRYIYILGKKKKEYLSSLRYPIMTYPKGENERYDSSYKPNVQTKLF